MESLLARFKRLAVRALRKLARLIEPPPYGPLSPAIRAVPDDVMRDADRPSLNRLCTTVDWEAHGVLSKVMNELNDSVCIHRKSWEYALCIHGLRQLDAVRPTSKAIAVGAGYERPLFLYANEIELMIATDLYDNPDHEGQPAMLTSPEDFAPFEYRHDHLQVLRMSGDQLDFPDEEFDFAFCLSSIEHFGSRETQRKSLAEMRRVLKPGGVAAIATELILNDGTHDEYFTYAELEEMFLRAPGFELVGGDLDLRIQQSLLDSPVDLDRHRNTNVSPHITLFTDGCLITSVMLFLQRTAD